MNMFKHELRTNFSSFAIWNVAIFGTLLLMMIFYPSIAADSENFIELINSYPDSFQEMIGFTPEMFTTVVGYFTVASLYAFIVGGIMAMIFGMNIFAKENRLKTLDFLLTKPATRFEIITAKFLSAGLYLVITNVIFMISAQVLCEVFSEQAFSNKELFFITLGMTVVQLFFFGFGMFISSAFHVSKSVISVALGSVFGFAILSMFSGVVDKDYFRYVTPFQAIDPNYVMANAGIEPKFIVYYIVLFAICTIVSYVIFIKKDVASG